MEKASEIREKIFNGRYISLSLFLFLLIYFSVFGFFEIYLILTVALLFSLVLASNEFLTNENTGGVAILHMVIIVLMIGAYDYFSSAGSRLNNFFFFSEGIRLNYFLNIMLAVVAILFVYGFYLGYRTKK